MREESKCKKSAGNKKEGLQLHYYYQLTNLPWREIEGGEKLKDEKMVMMTIEEENERI